MDKRGLGEAGREAYRAELCALKGDAFVDEILDAFQPDDYDGEFTTAGNQRYGIAEAELRRRLSPGHRRCVNCGRAIARHHKWRHIGTGIAHRNCVHPDDYSKEAEHGQG